MSVPTAFEATGNATTRVRSESFAAEVVQVERRVLVDVDEADGQVEVVGELEPGRDVGVVVELRAEDLVAGPEIARDRPRERERERRHVRAEDDLVPAQPRNRPATSRERCVELLGAAARLVRPARVRVRGAVVVRDRVDHLVGDLRPAGAVEEHEVALERREARAGGGDVKRHATPPGESSASRSGERPALPGPLGDVAGGLGERPEGQPVGDRAVDRDELEGGLVGVGRGDPARAGRSSPRRRCSVEELLRHPDDVLRAAVASSIEPKRVRPSAARSR